MKNKILPLRLIVEHKYDKATLTLSDGTIVEGKIDGWTNCEDGGQIQVEINGETYLLHSSDIVLVNN